MLPRNYRLKKKQEIKQVLEKGRFFNSSFLGLKVHLSRGALSRFCFVVSNKVNKKPTGRNLIKRRLRYALRKHLSQMRPGYDVVVLTKPEIKKQTYREIEQSLVVLLNKAGVLKWS